MTEQRRFQENEHELPGVGNYNLAKTCEYTTDSIGKKGYGPLASGTTRFKRRVVYTGPGPGEYRQRDLLAVAADSYFNRGGATANFLEKVSSSCWHGGQS